MPDLVELGPNRGGFPEDIFKPWRSGISHEEDPPSIRKVHNFL